MIIRLSTFLLTGLLFIYSPIMGQKPNTVKMLHLGKTQAIKDVIAAKSTDKDKIKEAKKNKPKMVDNFFGKKLAEKVNPYARPNGPDPVWQKTTSRSLGDEIIPKMVLEGLDRNDSGGVGVPDTDGDVGLEHYFQIVNASEFCVWDKEGNPLTGVMSTNTIWNQIGRTSGGDPIVLYDQLAGRWLLTEFTPPGQNYLLIAISEGEDPLGSYDVYEFSTPSFPDYPKYAIWDDVIVCTSNEFIGDGMSFYLIDRMQLLAAADQVNIQRHTLPYNGANGFFVMTPVDLEGFNLPKENTKPIIMRINDDVWGTASTDRIEYFTIDSIDWNSPNNTQISAEKVIELAPFDSDPCSVGGFGYDCVPQPGNVGLDAIPQVIMHRAVYRNFISHESLVFNFVVDADGENRAGIRWVELRKTDQADWHLFQEGTYAPDDGLDRYLGATSIDAAGNIALAFNVSSEDTYASLRFTGRRASDPPGEMTINEYEFAAGLSSSPTSRWGDYAVMNVDPSDDRLFWFTGEYMAAGSSWGTKILALEIARDTIDIGAISVISPVTSSALTNMEFPIIEVKNFGIDTQYQFAVGYQIDDGDQFIESVNDTLDSDERLMYTFNTNSFDFTELKEYEVKVFSSLQGDTNPLNDTFITKVTKLAKLDLAVVGIKDLEVIHCQDTIRPVIIVKNQGTDTLFSFHLNYHLNGGLLDTKMINDTLIPGQISSYEINLFDFTEGENDILAYTSGPNDGLDEIPVNDSLNQTFQYLFNPAIISLELLTDKFPEESSWELKDDETQEIIFRGGPYPGQSSQLIIEDWCLDSTACYTFTIFDSAGDGLFHPAFEDGSYQIVDENGKIMANMINVNFGQSETSHFCATFSCTLEGEIDIQHLSEPGVTDGVIMLTGSGGVGPFQYSINGGLSFQDENTFFDLDSGQYHVVLMDQNGCTFEETISIATCQLALVSSTITDASGASQNDGSIMLDVNGAYGSLLFSIDGEHTFQEEALFENLGTGDYTIVAVDSLGCRLIIQDLAVGFGTGIHHQELLYKIKTIPNPTGSGLVFIQIEGLLDKATLPVEIYNGLGQFLFDHQFVRYHEFLDMHLSLLNYPAGVYYVRFKDRAINRLIKIVRL